MRIEERWMGKRNVNLITISSHSFHAETKIKQKENTKYLLRSMSNKKVPKLRYINFFC